MIANELERCAVSYLANAIVGGEEPLIVGNDNPVVVTLGEQDLRIYRGESNVDRVYPCVIVNCDGGEEDFDTGNETCPLEVLTMFQADPATENPAPLDALNDTANGVSNLMRAEDLVDKLNVYAGENFSAIGVSRRSHRKITSDRSVSHYQVVDLYCAGRNVNAPI